MLQRFLGTRVFTGEGAADLFDENFQPKPALAAVQHDLALAGMSRH